MNTANQATEQKYPESEQVDLKLLFRELACTPDGLGSTEARKRLEKFGPNALEEKSESALLKFLSFFWGPIPWMIEVAAALSGIG